MLFVHVFSLCYIDYAKQSLYRAFHLLYGKIARTASEEVTLSLTKAECIPCLLYELEARPLGTMEMNSLNFAVKGILFTIFRTNSDDIVQSFQLNLIFKI